MSLLMALAAETGWLDPYQDQPGKEPAREERGGWLRLPGLQSLGFTFYPSVQFPDTAIQSRTASGIDAHFHLSTFLSGLAPWHTHVSLMRLEDKSDLDVSVLRLGTGIRAPIGGALNLHVTLGTLYLHGDDVDGRRFGAYFEIRLSTQGILLPGSHVSLGYLNMNNLGAAIGTDEIDTIQAVMLTVGFGQ